MFLYEIKFILNAYKTIYIYLTNIPEYIIFSLIKTDSALQTVAK